MTNTSKILGLIYLSLCICFTTSLAHAQSMVSAWITSAGMVQALHTDANNNVYYAADTPVLNQVSPSLTTSTWVSPVLLASFNQAAGITTDDIGNIYFSDNGTHSIYKVNTTTGNITTIAGTGLAGAAVDNVQANAAQFNNPSGIAILNTGNIIVADMGNHVVRQVNIFTNNVTTIAGTGIAGYTGDNALASNAQLSFPSGLAVSSSGGIYVSELGNHTVRRFSIHGSIQTIVGTGTAGFLGDAGSASLAKLNQPSDVTLDAAGNLLIADTGNHRIRRMLTVDHIITTIAGTGSPVADTLAAPTQALATALPSPSAIAIDGLGNIYVNEGTSNRILQITPDAQTESSLLNNNTGASCMVHQVGAYQILGFLSLLCIYILRRKAALISHL